MSFNVAKQFVLQKLGKAKRSDVPEDYEELRASYMMMDSYLPKISKYTKTYCQKTESVTKVQREMGDFLVESGLKDRSNFGESLIKVGESIKSLSTIHHAMLVNIIQNFTKPSLEAATSYSEGAKLHKKYASSVLTYDAEKSEYESLQQKGDSAKGKVQEEKMLDCESKMNSAYEEADYEFKCGIKDRDTKHLKHLIELYMAYHHFFAEGYTLTSDLLNYLERQKKFVEEQKNVKVERKSGGVDTTSAPSIPKAENNVVPPPINPPVNTSIPQTKKPALTEQSTYKEPPNMKPVKIVKSTSSGNYLGTAIVSYDYEAQDRTELSLKEGTEVKVLNKIEQDGWWIGEYNGKKGQFPSNYVDDFVAKGETRKGGGNVKQINIPNIKEITKKVNAGSSTKGELMVALFDFAATDDEELSFKKGDKLNVIDKSDEGWWVAEFNGKKGQVPSNYLDSS